MDSIDVHDLPEEQAQLVAAFVAFLRQQQGAAGDALRHERDWTAVAAQSFAKDWENTDDAVYDNWREHYHV